MRVGIDYLPAVCHAPGIGRYARELVRALVRLPDAPELALFEIGGGARSMQRHLGLEGARARRYRSRLPRRLVRALHRATGWGAERWLGGVDLFHRSLADYPPVARVPEVLPVPELPAAGSPADVILRDALGRAAAALVFCEHYARLLPERYGVDPERVHRVRVGCEHWTRSGSGGLDPSAAVGVERDGRPAQVLALGALRHERLPLAVLSGFEALRRAGRRAELCFVGHPGSAARDFEAALARSPVRGDVTWVRSPVEADMPALVARASLLVHLALEEGTPVTPLEAFAAGVPVVASKLPAFVEALDDQAHYVDGDPADPALLAAAMEAGILDGLAQGTGETGGARERRRALARTFTWEQNARATCAIWSQVLAARGGPSTGGRPQPIL